MAVQAIVLVVSGTLALGLGWAIGANDAANALGAAFGAGILSVRRGVQIAAVAEFVGAATLGSQVAATLATKVLDQCTISNTTLEGCQDASPGPFAAAPDLKNNDRWATVNCAALCGAALFLALATKAGLPASSTHSAIAALVGTGLVGSAIGLQEIVWDTVQWSQIETIVASWVVSPCLGSCIAFLMHIWVIFSTHQDAQSSENGVGYWLGPLASSSVAFVCTALCTELLHQRWPEVVGWEVVIIAAAVVAVVVHTATAICLACKPTALVRWNRWLHHWSAGHKEEGSMTRKLREPDFSEAQSSGRIPEVVLGKECVEIELAETPSTHHPDSGGDFGPEEECSRIPSRNSKGSIGSSSKAGHGQAHANGVTLPPAGAGSEDICHQELSTTTAATPPLSDADAILVGPILSLAGLMCVAHGSNDVANALGPFVAVLSAYGHGTASGGGPWWSAALVGAGILGGVAVQGYRVMQTVGSGIAQLNVKSSFTCQLSTVATVLLASGLGLPVSTTHVLIGALCGVAGADTLSQRCSCLSSTASSQCDVDVPGQEGAAQEGGMSAGGGKTLLKIAGCWVATLPVAAALAGVAFFLGASILGLLV